MRSASNLEMNWSRVCTTALAVGALALLWRVRVEPLSLGASVRLDALSAFFIFATLAGVALLPQSAAHPLNARLIQATFLFIVAYITPFTFGIGIVFILAVLVDLWQDATNGQKAWRPRRPDAFEWRLLIRGLPEALARMARGVYAPIAAILVMLGLGLLAGGGALRYDQPAAGTALQSFSFALLLLASAGAATPLMRAQNAARPTVATGDVLRIAWLYPLMRLYSFGPWNTGWSYATILLGGAAAGWCAILALVQPDRSARARHAAFSYYGLALAGVGLSTSAGLAAGCYAMLVYVILAAAGASNMDGAEVAAPAQARVPATLVDWLLSAAFPLGAPFIAAWMLMGAGVAGGVALLAGVAWLVALLHALGLALWANPSPDRSAEAYIPAAASALFGIGSPLVVLWLIQPAVEQLQGGLTPYGDVNIWPWIGLATGDAAHTQVTTVPSIAIALLMLVLCALIYVLARLGGAYRKHKSHSTDATAPDAASIWRAIRDDVPWLAALLGPERASERRPGDSQ